MKRRVIIVDTEPRFCGELATKLQRADFEVYRAPTVEQALAQLQVQPAELVLIDLDVPAPNGWAAVARMSQLHPDLGVIGLTERSDLAELASRAHLSGLAEKPVEYKQLLSALKAILAQNSPTREFCLIPSRTGKPPQTLSVHALESTPCPAAYSGWGINE